MDKMLGSLSDFCTRFGLKLIAAAVCMIAGLKLTKLFLKLLSHSRWFNMLDKGLQSFVKSMIKILLYVLIFITSASILGIPTTSFLTMLASAGLAVGLALQGSLSNFAGGIMILFFKPFKVGDFIDVCSQSGTVTGINAFYTVLRTIDNKTVTIPNGSVANGNIVNYSSEPERRVDMTFSASYSSPEDKVKEILLACARESAYAVLNPEPFCGILDHSESSVDFVLRVWCKTENYWNLYFELNENVKKAFDNNGIEIPYRQLDIHLRNNNEVK